MLLIATVTRRGLADRTFDEASGPVEQEYGRRNALVKTPGGQVFHIHDRQHFVPCPQYARPELYASGKGPGNYPKRGSGLVIIETRGATRKHGANLEPRRWTRASDYRKALGISIARTEYVSYVGQPALLDLVMNFMRDDFGPTNSKEWRELEAHMHRLQRKGIDPTYLQYLKSYFLLGNTDKTAECFLS